jgi:hypothetical protein
MKAHIHHIAITAIFIGTFFPTVAANAQLGGLLEQGNKAGSSNSLGNLGEMGSALSGQSLTAGSTGNVAGVLSFCIKNNYLSGNSASSVKDSLMGKLSGKSPSSDSGYADGERGILDSKDGKQFDLRSEGGFKAKITKQICDRILSQAKSML